MGEAKLDEIIAAHGRDAVVKLDEARRILVGQEFLSGKLPDALRLAPPNETAQAIRPAVETCIIQSVRRDPQLFADALFPVLIPAIKRVITDSFRRFVQTIDEILSRSFSHEGILWRIEAMRSGRPYAEIVLRHTLLFRVEDVFLVHQPSGILLAHVSRHPRQYADQIAGMLTAIRDFGTHALATRESEPIDRIEYGERAILVEGAREISLAAVIRGNPPVEYRALLVSVRARILNVYREALHTFAGDVSRFASSEDLLETCLIERAREPVSGKSGTERRAAIKGALCAAFLLLLSAMTGVTFYFFDSRASRAHELEAFLALLAQTPGVVVLDSRQIGEQYKVRVLKDGIADISRYRAQDWIHVTALPFISADPEIIKAKLAPTLEVPAGVHWSFSQGILSLYGAASRAWIAGAVERARTVPGVAAVDTSHMEELDAD